MVIPRHCASGTSRRCHPALVSAALVLASFAAWYLTLPVISRLLPPGVSTDDRGIDAVIGDTPVVIAPRSRIAVRSNDPEAARIFIERGVVTFDVVPRSRREPFEVYSGDLLVTANDARFTVDCWRDRSRVVVERGVVDVAASGRVLSLSAGDRWAPGAAEVSPREDY